MHLHSKNEDWDNPAPAHLSYEIYRFYEKLFLNKKGCNPSDLHKNGDAPPENIN